MSAGVHGAIRDQLCALPVNGLSARLGVSRNDTLHSMPGGSSKCDGSTAW